MKLDSDRRVQVLLSMQMALLGMVTPRMASVLVSSSASSIRFRVRFSGVVGEAEVERVSEIETELLALLPEMEVAGLAQACVFPE